MTTDQERAGGVALSAPSAGSLRAEVELGRRVVVVSDLLLSERADASSTAACGDFVRLLDRWQGQGLVVVCGNLFDLSGSDQPSVQACLDQHRELGPALARFSATEGRRCIALAGWRDRSLIDDDRARRELTALGVEIGEQLVVELTTAAGVRQVLVEPAGAEGREDLTALAAVNAARPWLTGADRLEDPSSSGRFVTSRLVYRRFGRAALWLLVPIAVALALRIPLVVTGLGHLTAQHGAKALRHAQQAEWTTRLAITAGLTLVELAVLGVVLTIVSRRVWSALEGGRLPGPWSLGVPPHDPDQPAGALAGVHTLDTARALIATGATGLISGGGFSPELSELDPGFFATTGVTGETVREHPGHFGMPPVFLHHRQAAYVELETGADLHVRLLQADVELPGSTLLERLFAHDAGIGSTRQDLELHPAVVASWPRGSSWPPPPDLRRAHSRTRRARTAVALAIFVAGVLDLVNALTPPFRSHLRTVLQVVPLGVAETAGALVAVAGLALIILSRGVRRGQRRAWFISILLLSASFFLHIGRGGDLIGSLLAALVVGFALVHRNEFGASTDNPSSRSALTMAVVGAVAIPLVTAGLIELGLGLRRIPRIGFWKAVVLSAERMVDLPVSNTQLPMRLNEFLSPTLHTLGISLIVVIAWLATRPVVDRHMTRGRAAELRARDIVRRHGVNTLDYFALRNDKQWFFTRDTLVAYGIYSGVALVSPDPIGPASERAATWTAFRRYADEQGWTVAGIGMSEEWLPIYRASGMHQIYIGDEALVDVQTFSLQGGDMKGLRQARNRVANKGYRATFHDPSTLGADEVASLLDLMGLSRRGEAERGFSMMLGRIFDPKDTGLLLTVVHGPDDRAVAMCQFVPSPGINGFSLDLMRRDPGEHPNGLIDFALCETIDYLKSRGLSTVSLNFAAMRSILDGESDGIASRMERWALMRLSGVLQIESLWRFNAKFNPDWLSRYIIFDSPEHLVPSVAAIMRAESLSEIPVLGRFLNTTSRAAEIST